MLTYELLEYSRTMLKILDDFRKSDEILNYVESYKQHRNNILSYILTETEFKLLSSNPSSYGYVGKGNVSLIKSFSGFVSTVKNCGGASPVAVVV